MRMNKRAGLILLAIPFISGCSILNFLKPNNSDVNNQEIDQTDTRHEYGAFLGRSEDTSHFSEYKNISIDIDEFSSSQISQIKSANTNIFAYLNIGSLENYRSYYSTYVNLTFLDYENWPDERWIDVSNSSWQNFVINTLAKNALDKGAYGVYVDNVDVYSVAKEEEKNFNNFKNGIRNILKGVHDLGLKVLMNGGAELIDDLRNANDAIFNYIDIYHQEEVFSLIDDYEEDIFTTQISEDKLYYQDIALVMKSKGKKIYFLEYTVDNNLKNQIQQYCDSNSYYCYISTKVDLI